MSVGSEFRDSYELVQAGPDDHQQVDGARLQIVCRSLVSAEAEDAQ